MYLVYKDNEQQWRWKFIASNGETIAVSSEGYVHLNDLRRSIQLLQESGGAMVVQEVQFE